MIRPYRPDDADPVVAAWREASELAHPFLTQEFLDREAVLLVEKFLPASETWVVEVGERVVGFVSVLDASVLDAAVPEIGGLFVAPAHHGRGLGWALLGHVRARHGALELEVFAANAIGRAFYDRAGFVEVGRRFDRETGEPVLRLQLAAP